jgi:excinuclease UvrABC helicase subunit UvrB
MNKFDLHAPFQPAGDQPDAIERLISNYRKDVDEQVLLYISQDDRESSGPGTYHFT